jgi:hypothetical protein
MYPMIIRVVDVAAPDILDPSEGLGEAELRQEQWLVHYQTMAILHVAFIVYLSKTLAEHRISALGLSAFQRLISCTLKYM